MRVVLEETDVEIENENINVKHLNSHVMLVIVMFFETYWRFLKIQVTYYSYTIYPVSEYIDCLTYRPWLCVLHCALGRLL